MMNILDLECQGQRREAVKLLGCPGRHPTRVDPVLCEAEPRVGPGRLVSALGGCFSLVQPTRHAGRLLTLRDSPVPSVGCGSSTSSCVDSDTELLTLLQLCSCYQDTLEDKALGTGVQADERLSGKRKSDDREYRYRIVKLCI